MYRVQCTLPYKTGLPEDVITNTFHFLTTDEWNGTLGAEINSRMVEYYNDIYAVDETFRLLAAYVEEVLIIRVFDANPPVSPNPPVWVSQQALTISGTVVNGWPAEVAVVSSQHSALTPGARLGRYFNRHYLGGFTARIGDATTVPDSPPVIRTVIRDRFATVAEALHDENTSALAWVIGRQVAGVWTPVVMTGGFVGNEPDTQRRRGVRQVARSNWTD